MFSLRLKEHYVVWPIVARTVMCRQAGRGRFPDWLDEQFNKLHEHWYTKISSLRCIEDRNPPQNASDLYMKHWSYAEHCRPCTRFSGANWWKKIKLTVPIGYSLFVDHRSVPSFGPGFLCLNYCLTMPKQSLFTIFAITRQLVISPWYHQYWNRWWPLSTWYISMSGNSGINFVRLPNRFCSSPPLLGFYWIRWRKTALPQASMPSENESQWINPVV